jgi:hypothetical protein
LAKICPCCELPINTVPLPMNYETTPEFNIFSQEDDVDAVNKTFWLTSGVSLYFTFVKMLILYLSFRFLLTDSFNLISSISSGEYCGTYANLCNGYFTSLASSYNKALQFNILKVVDVLNLITVILSIIFFNFYRKIQYRIYSIVDYSQHTQNDYTIFLSDIPILFFTENTDPEEI